MAGLSGWKESLMSSPHLSRGLVRLLAVVIGVIGALMGGLLVGILGARAFAGVVAAGEGWRAVYLVGARLMVATAAALWRWLPGSPPAVHQLPGPAASRGPRRPQRAGPALASRYRRGCVRGVHLLLDHRHVPARRPLPASWRSGCSLSSAWAGHSPPSAAAGSSTAVPACAGRPPSSWPPPWSPPSGPSTGAGPAWSC